MDDQIPFSLTCMHCGNVIQSHRRPSPWYCYLVTASSLCNFCSFNCLSIYLYSRPEIRQLPVGIWSEGGSLQCNRCRWDITSSSYCHLTATRPTPRQWDFCSLRCVHLWVHT